MAKLFTQRRETLEAGRGRRYAIDNIHLPALLFTLDEPRKKEECFVDCRDDKIYGSWSVAYLKLRKLDGFCEMVSEQPRNGIIQTRTKEEETSPRKSRLGNALDNGEEPCISTIWLHQKADAGLERRLHGWRVLR